MKPFPFSSVNKKKLEDLYSLYNNRRFVHPDPLEFLYDYPELQEREIVSLLASSLAYGRVVQILKSVSAVLAKMTPTPYSFLVDATQGGLNATFSDFKHRFTTGEELAHLLWAAKKILEQYGSLYACFVSSWAEDDDTVFPALCAFMRSFYKNMPSRENSLLPWPERKSACKRLNLFLRWMVRKDEVDPGGWDRIPGSQLIVPLDTHMHRIGLRLSMTKRKQADLRTALEVTHAFRHISPHDPVRYDFALTRLGILGYVEERT